MFDNIVVFGIQEQYSNVLCIDTGDKYYINWLNGNSCKSTGDYWEAGFTKAF